MRSIDVRGAIQDEYARLAARYEQRWGDYVRRTTSRTLAALHPSPGEAVLDVGCGTGALLQAVLEEAPDVEAVGLDLSAAMLAVARRRLGNGARLVAAEASLVPMREKTFDAAVSASSFHYWPDPAASLAELRRVLRPGGRLVITDWCDDFLACRLCDRWLQWTRRSYHRIYGAGECRALVEAAGFVVVAHEQYKVGWAWGMMTLVARASPPGP